MSVSVVQYHQSSTGSPQKLNILQQNTTQNVQINLKTTDNVFKNANSLSTLNPKDILLTNPARKKSKPDGNIGSPKLSNPAPVAVARRNARERNRVKQVNNGFATLRQHIPNQIAAAFESSTGRGGSKKLSKVETLRMAVEYIRTLEDILGSDSSTSTSTTNITSDQSFSENSENISSSSISHSYNSLSSASTPSSSPINTTNTANINTPANINLYSYPIMSPLDEDDDISCINYSTTKNYQIPIGDFYDNDNLDNLERLEENILSADQLIDGDLDLLNSMQTTGSLSPELYSDESLSPIVINRCRSTNAQMFIPVFNSSNEDIKLRITPEMIMEIKTEPVQEMHEEEEDSKENMVQVMQWWEAQQRSIR